MAKSQSEKSSDAAPVKKAAKKAVGVKKEGAAKAPAKKAPVKKAAVKKVASTKIVDGAVEKPAKKSSRAKGAVAAEGTWAAGVDAPVLEETAEIVVEVEEVSDAGFAEEVVAETVVIGPWITPKKSRRGW